VKKHLKELIKLATLDKSIDSFTPKIEATNKKLKKYKKRLIKYKLS